MTLTRNLIFALAGLAFAATLLQTVACRKAETIAIEPERIRAEYLGQLRRYYEHSRWPNLAETAALDHWDNYRAQETLLEHAKQCSREPVELLLIEAVANNINTCYLAWAVVADRSRAHLFMCHTDQRDLRLTWEKGSVDVEEWRTFREGHECKLTDLTSGQLPCSDGASWYIFEQTAQGTHARTGYGFDLYDGGVWRGDSDVVRMRCCLRAIHEFIDAHVFPWYRSDYNGREWVDVR